VQFVDVLLQLLFAGHAREEKVQHFQGSLGRLLAGPQADEQAGDDAQVQLDRDAVLAGGEQVATTQDALEPTKEQFHRPAVAVTQGHVFRVQIQTVRGQEQNFRPPLAVRLTCFDLQHPHRLLEDGPARGAAQHDHAVGADAGRAGDGSDRAFLDHGPDGVVADAADKAATAVDDVLEPLLSR
jgi:hypothetical protein